MELQHLNSKDFDEKISGSKGVVMVDFFATWCGPCRMLTPILESAQEDLQDKATIYKVDVDECIDIAKRFGIMSVPTMIIFKDGKQVDKIIGLKQKEQLVDLLSNM